MKVEACKMEKVNKKIVENLLTNKEERYKTKRS